MLVDGRGGDKDPTAARGHFEAACTADPSEYKDACLSAGLLHQQEKGGKAKARELYGKACEAGELTACRALGQLMILGEGGDKDPKQARTLFDKACEGGDGAGCFALAIAHQKGLGGKKNKKKAKELKQKACDAGFKDAC